METKVKVTLSLTPTARKLLAQLALAHGYNRSVMMETLLRDEARRMNMQSPGWREALPPEQKRYA